MAYNATEKDIERTAKDFTAFCEYIKINMPPATLTETLPPKACMEINALLSSPEEKTKANSRMVSYPSICLWSQIAKRLALVELDDSGRGKPVFHTTENYDAFQKMNAFTQYLGIFTTWLRTANMEDLCGGRTYYLVAYFGLIDRFFEELSQMKAPRWILWKSGDHSAERPSQVIAEYCHKLVQTFDDLGLLTYVKGLCRTEQTPFVIVEKMKPTNLGLQMMRACDTRRVSILNDHLNGNCGDYSYIPREKDSRANKSGGNSINQENFFEPFLTCFSKDEIDIDALVGLMFNSGHDDPQKAGQAILLKVSLPKRCHCKIRIAANATFEDLHLAIQNAFAFDNDHLYAFFLDGKAWSRNSINSPYSEEPPFANEVRLSDTPLRKSQRLLYLFDFGSEWRLPILIESVEERGPIPSSPQIIKFVGTPPRQYRDEEEDDF